MKRVAALVMLAVVAAVWSTAGSASADDPLIFWAHLTVQDGESPGVPVGQAILLPQYNGGEVVDIEMQLETAGIDPVSVSVDDEAGHNIITWTLDPSNAIPAATGQGRVYTVHYIDSGGAMSPSELIDKISQGSTYVNVHSADGSQIGGLWRGKGYGFINRED